MQGADPHWSFVIASYAATALVLGGLIVSVVLDLRRQRRLLDDLELNGSRRRRGAASHTG